MKKSDSLQNLFESEEESEDDDSGLRKFFHPKLRKHWKTIMVAALLLVSGMTFLIFGLLIETTLRQNYKDGEGPNGYIFFLCAGVCLVPGAYHIIYIMRAMKGHKGYKMEDVTMFHE